MTIPSAATQARPLFYLGAHQPHWLAVAGVPLFVSHRRLAGRRTLPRAVAPWALDSGGFTELSMFGRWRTTARQYTAAVRRYRDEIGHLQWAAPRDWMCEPRILARTGLIVAEHQRRTIADFLDLRTLAPDLPFIPVLQGWCRGDHLDHVAQYAAAGVDLAAYPVVGVGSVCRRQNTLSAFLIFTGLARETGLRLHGFGVKTAGLADYGRHLASADSLAWSVAGRREPGCTRSHASEANCLDYAMDWRDALLARLHRATRDQAAPAAASTAVAA
ncbi:deazapurine DNA modification protein DpdA family protein [Dactylosporangium darangshiense]|uniref:DeoxyPurine in DNA protein A domain-containing protein n=1 Tax=Dactylosporangium darangshiense TaxID=579108 RepID=A0ABP8DI41_9ACTN